MRLHSPIQPNSSHQQRTVSFSVNLPSSKTTTRSTVRGTQQDLLSRFASYDLPATWTTADAPTAELRDQLSENHFRHELGLQGNAHWLTTPASRSKMGRYLAEWSEAAESLGTSLSTLVLQDVTLEADFDLLVKHGINLVVPDTTGPVTTGPATQPLHSSIWEMPATIRLTDTEGLFSRPGSAALKQIDRSMAAGEMCHVVVDGQTVTNDPRVALSLERVLEHVTQREQQGILQVQTLAERVADLSAPIGSHPVQQRRAA